MGALAEVMSAQKTSEPASREPVHVSSHKKQQNEVLQSLSSLPSTEVQQQLLVLQTQNEPKFKPTELIGTKNKANAETTKNSIIVKPVIQEISLTDHYNSVSKQKKDTPLLNLDQLIQQQREFRSRQPVHRLLSLTNSSKLRGVYIDQDISDQSSLPEGLVEKDMSPYTMEYKQQAQQFFK
ncbi:hypothetical protein SS50377_27222 [Spironucleus salmonicida]|uniref:Uncharacterized protein n=1 Tax=Spironucleus salmonicida TaxID=348837 RepID=V6LWI8_9EUKA|nr:hypothetical protein SS50377_27222 [Spironucleus salmonicida]|eukprot:EST48940.1 Hypothetical protein SS50377_10783 [Spironucleus salmonicida]